jgi:glycosyltransferase involved in cell wall biosynthesis
MRPLDILYVGTLPPHPGGSAVLAAYLLAGLRARGHIVRALSPMATSDLHAPDVFALRNPDLAVDRYAVPWFSSDRATASQDAEYRRAEVEGIASRLPRLLSAARPDVVLLGRESVAQDFPEAMCAPAIPVVVVVHGGTTLAGALDAPASLAARTLFERFRVADLVVTVAHHLTDRLRQRGFGRVMTIPNPVDLDLFAPGPKDTETLAALDIAPDSVVVLHASNLKPVKRLLDLVASAGDAVRRCPRLAYLIVGEGPCRSEMEHACRRAGLLDRFRFTGWVEHGRIPLLMRLADLVAMPSESEGQAFVYLEAQACARVLVASDIPAAREVAVHDETALLFPAGDVAALAEATLRAARDPALRARIGAQARERVRAHALPDVVAAYERALVGVARR